MIGGALKLGLAVGIGYAAGGKLGEYVLTKVTTATDMATHRGAEWAGRVVVFAAIMYVL